MAPTGLPPQPADSKHTKWVFNPPPGWPVPPVGWQPEPGWQPDPSWPLAPADWKFWKPEQDPGRHRFSTSVKAMAGALTLAATIVGTYVTYLAFHDNQSQFTTSNWVRQANAACDQDVGALNESLFNGLAPSTADQQGSSAQSSQVNRVGALVGAVNSLSKLVGDLADLSTPQDSRASQVQAVISSGRTLVGNLGAFSTAAQDAVENIAGTTTAQDLATERTAYKQFQTTIVVWRKAIGALDLAQCPFWSSTPNAPPPSPPPVSPTPPQGPTVTLTYGEQQLANTLNSNDLTSCTGRPALEGDGIVAAVNCSSVEAGPTLRPLVVQFSDIESALTWFANNTVGFVDQGNCADGYRLGTWTHNDIVSGPLGCAYVTGGDFRIVWVIDSALIGVMADGSYGPAMAAWWQNPAYVV